MPYFCIGFGAGHIVTVTNFNADILNRRFGMDKGRVGTKTELIRLVCAYVG